MQSNLGGGCAGLAEGIAMCFYAPMGEKCSGVQEEVCLVVWRPHKATFKESARNMDTCFIHGDMETPGLEIHVQVCC